MDNIPSFITRFIELYRSHPCLWKIKDESYSNKRQKEAAYLSLVNFYKQTIPYATVDTVRKKINNLRCSFRKELKKARLSQSSGASEEEVYVPSLWYFNLLMFSADQEDSKGNQTLMRFSTPVRASQNEESSQDADTDDAAVESPSSSQSWLKMNPQKRKSDMMQEAYKAIATKDDEFDAIGANVSCKLRRMNEDQRNYAEFLINKVILHGVCRKLTENSDVVLHSSSSLLCSEDPLNASQKSSRNKRNNVSDDNDDFELSQFINR